MTTWRGALCEREVPFFFFRGVGGNARKDFLVNVLPSYHRVGGWSRGVLKVL